MTKETTQAPQSLSKQQLKKELGLPSVEYIKTILKALGQQDADPVSEENANLVRQTYQLIKGGVSLADAIAQVKGGSAQGKASSQQERAKEQAAQQHKAAEMRRQQIRGEALKNKAVEDAIQEEQAYWYFLTAAKNSPQVQESARVQEAIATYQASAMSDSQEVQNEIFLGGMLDTYAPLLLPMAGESSPTLPSATQASGGNGAPKEMPKSLPPIPATK